MYAHIKLSIKTLKITGILVIVTGIFAVSGGFKYLLLYNEDDILNKNQSEWENIHLVEGADIKDLPLLKELGARQILQDITLNPIYWAGYYKAIIENNLQLIPVIWKNHQTAWQWNDENSEWELDFKTYPNSIGARFINFLKDNPVYLQHTFAIYSFHEPLNYENKAMVSPFKQKKFWKQIHEELFPGNSLKIYGESISWSDNCKNGCVDYDGVGYYYFSRSDKGPDYMYPVYKRKNNYGLYFYTHLKTKNREEAIQLAMDRIDLFYETVQEAPPAPDGSRTKHIPLIQAFSIQTNHKIWNRMPAKDEMNDWALKVIGAQKNKVAGLGWYCFRPASKNYTQWLEKDRYDIYSEDRWQSIKEIAGMLFDDINEDFTQNE